MRRSRTSGALLVLLVIGIPVLAQPDERAEDERDPQLRHWKWMQELKLPADASGRYLALPVAPAVFGQARVADAKMEFDFHDKTQIDGRDHAADDLRDLRLADTEGTRVPYALRVMRRRVEHLDVPFMKIDQGWSDESRTYQSSLEMGQDLRHNEIEIHTTGNDFRRRVVVEGSATKDFEEPRTVLDRSLVRYNVEGRVVEVHRFDYDLKDLRHLRVRVHADPTSPKDQPKITRVVLRRSTIQEGEYATDAVKPGNLEPVRGEGGPGSAWMVEFPSRMPCEKLTFEVKGLPREHLRLQVADGQARIDIPIRERSWRKEGDRLLLEVSFNEVIAQRMRLIVTDFANPPLSMEGVQVTRCVRKLIIEKADADKIVAPLRLYVGNPNVGPANYVLSQQLPARIEPAPALIEAGPLVPNPTYVPPPQTLHERAPWLVYVVLGVACAVLLLVLGMLARQAIHRHDAQAPVEAPAA